MFMPQLSEVLSGILRDIAAARLEADTASAKLVEYYKKDPVLSCFPLPRVDIKELHIELKFAVAGGGERTEIIVDAKSLQELRDGVVSTLRITTGIANYDVIGNDSGDHPVLVERDA
jgi:hypothetical protein